MLFVSSMNFERMTQCIQHKKKILSVHDSKKFFEKVHKKTSRGQSTLTSKLIATICLSLLGSSKEL